MTRVTSTEFQQNVGTYSDTALQEPVIITSHNRDRLVLMGVEEYKKLKSLEDEMDKKMIDEQYLVHRDTHLELSKR